MDTLYIIDRETGLTTDEGKGRSFLTGRLTGGLANISSGDSRVDDSIVRLDGNSSLDRRWNKRQVEIAKHNDNVTSSRPQNGTIPADEDINEDTASCSARSRGNSSKKKVKEK